MPAIHIDDALSQLKAAIDDPKTKRKPTGLWKILTRLREVSDTPIEDLYIEV